MLRMYSILKNVKLRSLGSRFKLLLSPVFRLSESLLILQMHETRTARIGQEEIGRPKINRLWNQATHEIYFQEDKI